jgi:hypothetical protein
VIFALNPSILDNTNEVVYIALLDILTGYFNYFEQTTSSRYSFIKKLYQLFVTILYTKIIFYFFIKIKNIVLS